jgi:carbamoyl-phosphate synthase large subunit
VLSASRKVLLVRAFVEAVRRTGVGRVIAGDLNPTAAALYAADGARLLPRSDDPGFVDELAALCDRDAVGLVVPTRDEELPVLAAARDRFRAAGTLALVSAPDAIDQCRDKQRFGSAVEAAGLEVPRTFDYRGDLGEVPLPAFVKPRWGKGGRGARAVGTIDELRAAIAECGGEVVVQECLEAPEYTVDTFLDLDGAALSCVPRERVQVLAGESIVSRTVEDPELVAAAVRLCQAIGLVGHQTVQAFRTRERIAFIEINPRYGGAANLGFSAGAPTPEFAVALARGEAVAPRLGRYERGLVMLRHADDLLVREDELLGSPPWL